MLMNMMRASEMASMEEMKEIYKKTKSVKIETGRRTRRKNLKIHCFGLLKFANSEDPPIFLVCLSSDVIMNKKMRDYWFVKSESVWHECLYHGRYSCRAEAESYGGRNVLASLLILRDAVYETECAS